MILTVVLLLGTLVAILALGGTPVQAAAWALVLTLASRLLPIGASFLIAYYPRRDGRALPLGTAATARAVLRELWATLLLFFFYHPFEKWVARREPTRIAPGATPIVLVHGFFSNAGFWRQIQTALEAAGWRNLFALNLEPPFADIEGYADRLREFIETVCERCGAESVIVVAHSMGGLAARACARRAPGRIRHVICLGSPHAGTVLASLVPAVNTRQMRRGSDWLQDLNTGDEPVPLTNLYSGHDNIIVPQSSAALAGTVNVRLPGIGHLDMAFSPVVISILTDVLRRLPDRPVT